MPPPLFFPDDAARRRRRIARNLGVGALVGILGGFAVIEMAAAPAVGVPGGVGGWSAVLACLLMSLLPLAMYVTMKARAALRSRAGMRVDTTGIHLFSDSGNQTGDQTGGRTLGWDDVRGHFDVVITGYPSRWSDEATLIRTVVVLGGNRIELPWLDVRGLDEEQAQERVHEHAVNLLARDPHLEAPVPEDAVGERPACLLMEQFEPNEAIAAPILRRFALIPPLALVAELAALIWGGSGYVLPFLVIPGVVGLASLGALAYLVMLFSWLYAPTCAVADATGLSVRGRQPGRKVAEYVLPWEQARGRLEPRVVKVPAGWEGQVVCQVGGSDVVLTGASLLADDKRVARLRANERVALISSYDPDAPPVDEDDYFSISPMRFPSSSR